MRLLTPALAAAAMVAAVPASALGVVPVSTAPPAISGTPQAGQTLTCSPGTWLGSPTSYAYSWQRNLSNVGGQTSNRYTLSSADVGSLITCSVVASNDAGPSALPAVSAPVGPIGSPTVGVPVPTALPAISGTPQAGQTVTCSSGSWTGSPTSYSYSWQRNAAGIAQGSPSYTLVAADVGQAITCAVVATNSAGDSLPALSAPILPTLASGTGTGGGTAGGGGAGTGASGSGGGTGGGGTGGGALPAPRVLGLSVVPGKMVVIVKGKRRSTKGTSFRYRLDRAASVLIKLQRRAKGGRWVGLRQFAVKNARAGSGILRFAGRIGRRLLGPGRYRVIIVASNAGGKSPSRSAPFTVVNIARR